MPQTPASTTTSQKRAPLLSQLLDELAESADRSTMGGRMGYAGHSPSDVIKLCRVLPLLARLPAARRYELLRQWLLTCDGPNR